MKRAALYMRVSTDQQALAGDSLREQEETLKRYVDSQNDMVIFSTYIDDGISGQKLERDEFQRLMTDVKNKQIDIILFTKLDRWFRSLRHYLNTQDFLEKYQVNWLAVSQPSYDTSTAYGRAFINQIMSFAELEAQMSSERINAVFANKIANGEVISGSAPLGYSIKDKRLVPNEDASIVKELFKYQDDYANVSKTTQYLYNVYGIRKHRKTILRMLKNKKYIGYHRDNHNYCEPIIDKKLFEKVNQQLANNRAPRMDTKRTYLFVSLIRCACCGSAMSGIQLTPKRKLLDGTIKVYDKVFLYRCRSAYENKTCRNKKSVREHLLERYLTENLENLIENKIYELKQMRMPQKKDNTEQIINNINKKLERLKKLYLDDVVSLDEYKIDREKLLKEMPQRKEVTNDESPEKRIEHLEKLLNENLLKHYKSFNSEEKALFWRKIIKLITFDNDREIDVKFL